MTPTHPDDLTLDAFADGTLADVQSRVVEAHLLSCPRCRDIVDGHRRVTQAARRLAPLTAPREGWARLEASIRAQSSARRYGRWQWLAAAAALLVAVLGGMKLADLRRAPAGPAAAAIAASATTESIEAELQQAEEHYQNAIAGLEKIANSEKASLDPQLAATLEKNLSVVDQAISESRAALRAQPASGPAQASLLESFKAKIALLQDTIALINEMRRAPSAGDGSVASGLKQKGN